MTRRTIHQMPFGIRIVRDSVWQEYIVTTREGDTYHTDDRDDAIQTARVIWAKMEENSGMLISKDDIINMNDDDMIEVANNVLASPHASNAERRLAAMYITVNAEQAQAIKEACAAIFVPYANVPA